MNTYQALSYLHKIGFPISIIAKRVGKDSSTIAKWLSGKSKYLAAETEESIKQAIREIISEVNKINLEQVANYMKLYPVFSRRIVTALEKLGYQVINIAPKKKQEVKDFLAQSIQTDHNLLDETNLPTDFYVKYVL